MDQSPGIYPANVLGNTQNRQQIATVLQSMGFETDDIAKAFTIFEKTYGDEKYDVSVLTEIVVEVQQNEENEINAPQPPPNIQSHSAPNQPPPPPRLITQPILHQNHFQPLNTNTSKTTVPTQEFKQELKSNANNQNDTEMLSIFNSLKIN